MLTTSLPLKKKVRGCFFDLDGTLEDSSRGILATIRYICQHYDIPYLGDDQLRPYAGEGLVYLMRLCQADLDDDTLHKGFALGLSYYREEGYKYNHPFPGVAELLELLTSKGIAWGIVTNKVRSIIDASLNILPFQPNSNLVICADDLPQHKPNPLPLMEICRRSGVLPQDALYIGDSLNDMKAADAAGLYGVFVTYGYGRYDQVATLDIKGGIINHLDELKLWLISIN